MIKVKHKGKFATHYSIEVKKKNQDEHEKFRINAVR